MSENTPSVSDELAELTAKILRIWRTVNAIYVYFRPDGVSRYFRPDGTSTYRHS